MKKEKEQPEKGKKKIEKLTDHESMWPYFDALPGSTNFDQPMVVICRKIDEIIDVINEGEDAIRKKLDEITNVINKGKGKKKAAKLTDTVGVTDIVKPTVIRSK